MKKIYTGFLLGALICAMPNSSHAFWNLICPCLVPPPVGTCVPVTADVGGFVYWTTDRGRGVAGIIASIMGLSGDGESKAQLIAQEEENNKKASGSSGSASGADTSSEKVDPDDPDSEGAAAGSEFSGSAFGYVNSYVLSKEGGVEYEPLKAALASAGSGNAGREKIRQAVLAFFADPDKPDQNTTEYKKQLNQNRNEYAREAAGRHVTLAYHVKGHIQNDLSVISSAAVSGDGELGSIAVDAHTLEQMIKMELVDLALQIEMMEAEAVQFLMHQPIELMPKTKPEN